MNKESVPNPSMYDGAYPRRAQQANPLLPDLSNATYDWLKRFALVILPALGALYFALANIWEFPDPEKVMGTVLAVEVFLGALLGLSKIRYNNSDRRFDGVLHVDQFEPGIDKLELEVTEDTWTDLRGRDSVEFRVDPR